jgi:hypothetical protein
MTSHITKRTTVIHDTVREAQELLSGMASHLFCEQLRSAIRYIDSLCDDRVPEDMSYPQSLGELCIELAQDSVRYWGEGTEKGTMGRNFAERLSRDIQDLRQLLYHKNYVSDMKEGPGWKEFIIHTGGKA